MTIDSATAALKTAYDELALASLEVQLLQLLLNEPSFDKAVDRHRIKAKVAIANDRLAAARAVHAEAITTCSSAWLSEFAVKTQGANQ